MRRQRNARVIATLGPASSTVEIIEALYLAGADVFRFNFSHGTHADHQARYEMVRAVEAKFGRPIGILADLQGPKLRVGVMEGGRAQIETGSEFGLDNDPSPGSPQRICLPHPELFAAVEPGQSLLLDDGKLRLEVISKTATSIKTRVINGGPLSDRKGVNVPDAILPIPVLTQKDRRDLDFALGLGVECVALSFVQRPEDLHEARAIIGDRALLMTKLEKPQAMEHLDEIVRLSDLVMVARGDLGVELPPERVPIASKRILRSCREQGKPTIVATQMLESMISSPTPTRAEASDVAGAIYDGADAVMLSAESASGAYPLLAVSMMDRIIREVESDPLYRTLLDAQHPEPLPTAADAICAAMRSVADVVNASANVTYTTSGTTSFRAARQRPTAPILCMTPRLETARRMAFVWGIHAQVVPDVSSVDEVVSCAKEVCLAEGFGSVGDRIVITAGMPFGRSGTTNLLRVATI
ncbi:MAG: pyruvate kinase [Burkholderiaceae bacterium]|nr:pyruvate kinase [Burkholderiaceae bacterium]